jgi:dihydroneopterin aldolase
MQSRLTLNELKFEISLGVYSHEKLIKQIVNVNVAINYQDMPKGCWSDKVEDVLCYDKLITYLRLKATEKHFELIENFAWFLFKEIAKYSNINANISIEVLKDPKIEGLGSAGFILEGEIQCKA